MKETEQLQATAKDTEDKLIRSVIISGGTIDREHALRVLAREKYDYIIVADKGLSFLCEEHIEPTHIVGDFDSLEEGVLEQYLSNPNIKIRIFNPIKDSTDTEIAIRLAMELKSKEIMILGGTGGRLDHTLGNIQAMSIPVMAGASCCMEDPQNRIEVLITGRTIRKEDAFGKYISFFPLSGNVEGLTLKGFKYPLENHTLTPFDSLAVSNEITEETAVISFRRGLVTMVMSLD